MRSNYTIFLILFFLASSIAFSQATGDFRSNGSGNWSNGGLWQKYNGTSWVAAGSAPTGAEVITLQGTDSLYLDVSVSITDTLRSTGGKMGNTSTALTIGNGGVYDHALNNGSIPVCTWAAGSTCLISGFVSGSKPTNGSQNFYNLVWNCPAQSATVDLGMTGNTIGGDFSVLSTGTGRLQLTSPTAYVDPITFAGNIYMSAAGGQFASNGSSSAASIVVNTMGNIVVTAGNFSMSRGSGPDVTWNLHGNFSVANATLQNSGGSARTQELVFAGNGVQTITLTNVTYGSGTAPFTMRVKSGATLDMGLNQITSSNSGSFKIDAGATIKTAQPGGFAGNIQCTGNSNGGGNFLSSGASYTFNGTSAQSAGSMLPDTVANLTIDNASGVTLTKALVINDTLHLVSGACDNTVGFTLGANGYVSFEGGSLTVPLGVSPEDGTVPQTFYVGQNYPNPFNPTTTIKFGLPNQVFVTAKLYNMFGQEVSTLFEGRKEAGVHQLYVDASNLASGVYLCRIMAGNSVGVTRMTLVK